MVRSVCAFWIAVAVVLAGLCSHAFADGRVILLGTGGGPGGRVQRAGIATWVEAGDFKCLIDAGEGVSRQLAMASIPENTVPCVMLTHLHDDHTVGLPALMSFAYTLRSSGLTLYGPPGTAQLLAGVESYLAVNETIRRAERPLPKVNGLFAAQELQPGAHLEIQGVKIQVLENTHYHLPSKTLAEEHKSYSYRFSFGDKVIVVTGDTGPSRELIAFAADADILIAEMVSDSDIRHIPKDVAQHMLDEHLSATRVGELATQARVKHLVLSHVGNVSEADLAQVKKAYAGQLTLGQDLAELAF